MLIWLQKNSLIFFIILLSLILAHGVIKIEDHFSLGSIAMRLVFPVVFMVAIWFIFQNIQYLLPLPEKAAFSQILSIRTLFLLAATIVLGCILTIILTDVEETGGMLTVFVSIFSILAFLAMLFLTLTRGNIWGLTIFIFLLSYWDSYLLKWNTQWLIWPYIAAVSSRMAIEKKLPIRTSFDKIIFIFLALLLVSSLASGKPIISLTGLLFSVLVPMLWFFLIVNIVKNRSDMVLLLMAFALSTIGIGIKYYFWLQAEDWKFISNMYDSYTELTGGGGSMSVYAAYTAPFVMGYMMLSHDIWKKIAGFFAIILLAYIMLIAGTRSAPMALLISSAFLMFYSKIIRKRYIFSVCIIIIIAFAVYQYLETDAPSLMSLKRLEEWKSVPDLMFSQAMRLDAWQAALHMTIDHPWLGIGLEMWPEYNPEYSHGFILVHAHNTFLNFVSAGGVGVVIIILSLIGLATWKGIKLLRSASDSVIRTAVLTGLSACWVEVVNGAIGGAWYFSSFFWTGIGLIAAAEHIERQSNRNFVLDDNNSVARGV